MVRKEEDTSEPLAEWIVVEMVELAGDSFLRLIGAGSYGAPCDCIASEQKRDVVNSSCIAPE